LTLAPLLVAFLMDILPALRSAECDVSNVWIEGLCADGTISVESFTILLESVFEEVGAGANKVIVDSEFAVDFLNSKASNPVTKTKMVSGEFRSRSDEGLPDLSELLVCSASLGDGHLRTMMRLATFVDRGSWVYEKISWVRSLYYREQFL